MKGSICWYINYVYIKGGLENKGGRSELSACYFMVCYGYAPFTHSGHKRINSLRNHRARGAAAVSCFCCCSSRVWCLRQAGTKKVRGGNCGGELGVPNENRPLKNRSPKLPTTSLLVQSVCGRGFIQLILPKQEFRACP